MFSVAKNHYHNGYLVQLNEKQLKRFKQINDYFDELLWAYMPSKVNFGGFPGNKNIIDINSPSSHMQEYGDFINYIHSITEEVFLNFLGSNVEEKLKFLAELAKKAVNKIALVYDVDTIPLLKTLDQVASSHLGLEMVLKISKNHRSRALHVEIIRSLTFEKEDIYYRIIAKNGDLLHEEFLGGTPPMYSLSHYYKKSKWHNDTLVIFDGFNNIYKEINVVKFLP